MYIVVNLKLILTVIITNKVRKIELKPIIMHVTNRVEILDMSNVI